MTIKAKKPKTKQAPKYRAVLRKHKSKNGEIKEYRYWQVDYVSNGKRKRKICSTEQEAEDYCQVFVDSVERVGKENFFGLSSTQAVDARNAFKMLKEKGLGSKRLVDCVTVAAKYLRPDLGAGRKKVGEVYDEYIAFKEQRVAKKQMRFISLDDIKKRLRDYVAEYRDWHIDTVDKAEADKWISHLRRGNGEEYTAVSIHNFRVYYIGFFNFALAKGYIFTNPFIQHSLEREGPLYADHQVEIFTVDEVISIMRSAEKVAKPICAALALNFFAGIRHQELLRLTWEDIGIEKRLVQIGREISKKRSHRLIPMQENLEAWLIKYRKPTGSIVATETTLRYHLAKILKDCGVKWKKNAPRHSFGSYFYELTGSIDATMKALSHKDESTFDEHYKNIHLSKTDAERYFGIMPIGNEGRIIQFKAG